MKNIIINRLPERVPVNRKNYILWEKDKILERKLLGGKSNG